MLRHRSIYTLYLLWNSPYTSESKLKFLSYVDYESIMQVNLNQMKNSSNVMFNLVDKILFFFISFTNTLKCE